MRRTLAVLAMTAGTLIVTTTTATAAPPDGSAGCAAFGANVSELAQTLGPQFGANASAVATSGPGAFPEVVVRPEKAALCP
ncbi:hypothetical protein [Georgenia subflava]|uniref:Uncharacterized protein n=1 Tax=Georgenia subflava TaxID=1622177 RepID=A0A6N7EPM0_9MICO|nr:hypothetical protein [Georgenia subflava]MPV38817.1 hypothetical protein [Georgenia subflava]